MIACQAAQLSASNYQCWSQGGPPPPDLPGPKVNTACETVICKFSCEAPDYVDININDHCMPTCI